MFATLEEVKKILNHYGSNQYLMMDIFNEEIYNHVTKVIGIIDVLEKWDKNSNLVLRITILRILQHTIVQKSHELLNIHSFNQNQVIQFKSLANSIIFQEFKSRIEYQQTNVVHQ